MQVSLPVIRRLYHRGRDRVQNDTQAVLHKEGLCQPLVLHRSFDSTHTYLAQEPTSGISAEFAAEPAVGPAEPLVEPPFPARLFPARSVLVRLFPAPPFPWLPSPLPPSSLPAPYPTYPLSARPSSNRSWRYQAPCAFFEVHSGYRSTWHSGFCIHEIQWVLSRRMRLHLYQQEKPQARQRPMRISSRILTDVLNPGAPPARVVV